MLSAAAAGTSMVPDLAMFLIAGSVIVTMYALQAGRHTKRKTKPSAKPSAKATAAETAAAPAKDRNVRREIEEFDLTFFSD
jgi:hypothetical protein